MEGSAPPAPGTRQNRFVAALDSTTFYVLAALGIVVALGLVVYEAQREDPIEIGNVRTEREGLTTVAEVRVRNTADEAKCPEIRIAARDTDGQDLDEVIAEPATGDEKLTPGQTAVYRAELSDISEREYQEELEGFSAYVAEVRPCP